MNQLRWDPTLCEWVSYATHRQDRTFFPPAEYCPLCPTKPGGFPTEAPRSSYEIAVFENKFPSFSPAAGESNIASNGFHATAPGRGVCEVVLYSDDHNSTLASMSEGHIRNLISVWADRYEELGSREEVEYVFIFENKGEAVGVTLHHPHGQIYGYPFVPPRARKEIEAAREYHRENDSFLHEDLLAAEHEDGRRVVAKGEHFTAFVPFYAHYPYEVHIYSRRPAHSVADLNSEGRTDLARILKQVLSGYDELFGFSLPYVMAMHQAPTDGKDYTGIAHFHIEFYPPNRTRDKLKYLAGSEVGAGAFVMDALPEDTAARLREAVEKAEK